MLHRFFLALSLSFLFCSCLERMEGVVGDYENLLVVDGLLTNEDGPYEVHLWRTTKNIDLPPEVVSDASVSVEDDMGNLGSFYETEPGRYQTKPGQFTGLDNRSYRLSIKTKQGEQYYSDWCELLPSSKIDSVYWEVEGYRSSFLNRDVNGLVICIDGKGANDGDNFFRWVYQEDWKFRANYADNAIVLENDSIVYRQPYHYYCWKSSTSTKVHIHTSQGLSSNEIRKKKLFSIHPADNNRISLRYSLLVKQMSISQKEYTFWKNLSQSDQDTWDLFGKQPYAIVSNIHNANKPEEPVLGYFQVAGVASKRIYINAWDIIGKDINNFFDRRSCNLDTVLKDDDNSFYDMYYENYIQNRRGLAGVVYGDRGEPIGLIFGNRACTDCSFSGVLDPPTFWEENEYN